MKEGRKWCSVVTAIVVALILTGVLASRGAAITTEEELKNWPAAMYQGADLEKVREWEKTWVGKKINKDNIDQVKEFVSDQFYEMFKNPTDWGADEIWFDIVPYQTIVPTPGQIAMTKKYAPTANLDPNPRKAFWSDGIGPNEFLLGWETGAAAGFPFPFPKSGVEMAWNLESISDGDTKSYDREGVVVNPRTRTERRAKQPFIHDFYTGRCDYEPLLKKPDNPKGIRRAMYLYIDEPLDVRGTRYMELRYLDITKPDDVWVWFPLFRRIRRMGFAYKSDTIDGSDLGPDDESGWNGHINRKNWEIVGRKEMLMGRHTNLEKYTKITGQALWSGMQLERTNAYVLQSKFKEKDAVYSNELLYMDPESWHCLQKVTWDRQGRVWRHFLFHTMIYNDPKKNINHVHTFELYSSDLQRRHGCPSIDKVKEIGMDIKNDFWTIQNLQKMGY